MANKVKFGISKAHVAIKTVAEDGTITYGTPFAVPGAVSISLEAQGELTPFYADNITYYTASSNAGYEGDLEMALINDEFREQILGEVADTNKVLIENANTQPKEFALLFQIEGNEKPTLFAFYNCTSTRPSTESETKEDATEPGTETLTIKAISLPDGTVRAKTGAETSDAVIAGWYNAVYMKDETGG